MRIQQASTIGRWFISSDSSSPFMERSRLRYLFTIDLEEPIKETMSHIAVFGRVLQVLILVHCPSLPSIVIDDRNTFNAYIYTVQDNRIGPFF